MNHSKTNLTVLLVFFLVSCGPVTAYPTSAPAARPQTTATPGQIATWPGFHDGWMYFKGRPYLNNPVYDPHGFLWATSANSVYRWNIETGEFTEFTSADGLPAHISGIFAFDDKIWIAADGKVSFYSSGAWTTQAITTGSIYYFSSSGDRLWVTASDGLYYLANGKWKLFDLIPEQYRSQYSHFLVAGSAGGPLWFSGGERVLKYDGAAWTEYPNLAGYHKTVNLSDGTLLFVFDNLIIRFDSGQLLPVVLPGNRYRYPIKDSLLTPEGDLWLQIYAPYTETITNGYPAYLIHNGQAKEAPRVVFKNPPDVSIYGPEVLTPKGFVFKTSDRLFLYDLEGWKKFSLEKLSPISQIMSNNVIGFAPDGSLWAARGGKPPARFNGNRIDFVIDSDSCAAGYYGKGLMDTQGNIYAGTPGLNSLCQYDTKTGRSSLVKLFFNIGDFMVSPNGMVWVASDAGFMTVLTQEYLKKNGEYTDLEMIKIGEGLVRHSVTASRLAAGPDGSVWVFVKNAGLYRYDGSGWKYFGLHGLQDPSAFAIDSRGLVWAGFPGKLLKFDGEGWATFPQNCICPTKLFAAPDDAIWFVNGCNEVYRFDGQTWARFTKEDLGGFIPDRILVAPDGALWFFGHQNAARYKP